jgi:hypothetical protein
MVEKRTWLIFFISSKKYKSCMLMYRKIVEGLRDTSDWNEVMKFRWKNGSLFNSPCTAGGPLINSRHWGFLSYPTQHIFTNTASYALLTSNLPMNNDPS